MRSGGFGPTSGNSSSLAELFTGFCNFHLTLFGRCAVSVADGGPLPMMAVRLKDNQKRNW